MCVLMDMANTSWFCLSDHYKDLKSVSLSIDVSERSVTDISSLAVLLGVSVLSAESSHSQEISPFALPMAH